MLHESLLIVTARGESIGKIIHHDGDDTFLAEGEKMFPRDFPFHYESNVGLCEDGALLFTLTDSSEDEPAASEVPRPTTGASSSR